MLTGKNIHKKYGTVEVLKGVDITVEKGEIVSIVGSSGAGKSTLLHILGTLEEPDAGYIEIQGVKIETQPKFDPKPAQWWKRLVNYIIDSGVIGLIGYGLLFILFDLATQILDPSLVGNNWVIAGVLFVATVGYYTLLEGLTGRSIGKFLTSSKVIEARTATKPGLIRALYRSLARFLPFEALSLLAKRPIGWHDGLANTMVIDNAIPYQKKLPYSLSPKELAMFRNRHIGFVFQFHHLLPEFSALENVCIPGWLSGKKKSDVKDRAIELLNILGLQHRLENKPNEMSGGEQQRVAVARALINSPAVVFADEPTGNLDSANAEELHKLFFDLRSKFNQTFLIVTHNEELAKLSDRVVHMKDGVITGIGDR